MSPTRGALGVASSFMGGAPCFEGGREQRPNRIAALMLAISRPSRLVIAVEADSRPRHAVERRQFPFVGGVYQGANVIKRRCEITRVRGNPFVGDWIDKDPIERGFVIVIESTDVSLLISIAERSEEHTSELQSLMRISYAVFCLKKKKHTKQLKYN